MILAVAAALLVLLVAPSILAAPLYAFDTGARTEIRRRQPGDPDAQGLLTSHAWDVDTLASAHLSLNFGRTLLGVGYMPRLILRDFSRNVSPDLLHTGNASWQFRLPRATLTLTERASFGERSFASLAGSSLDPVTGQAVVQSLPGNVAIRYMSTDTTLDSSLTLSPRSRLNLAMSYGMSGGADAVSRTYVPEMRGPRALASWEWRQTRKDVLITAVDGTSQKTTGLAGPPIPTANIVRSSERLRRLWSRRTTTELAVGVTLVAPSKGDAELSPNAAASLNHIVPGPGRGNLAIILAGQEDVFIDRLTGLTDARVQATFGLTWTVRAVALYGTANRVESLSRSGVNSIQLTVGEGGVRYEFGRGLSLDCGVRVIDQKYLAPGAGSAAASGLRWLEFAALSYTADTIR